MIFDYEALLKDANERRYDLAKGFGLISGTLRNLAAGLITREQALSTLDAEEARLFPKKEKS